MVCQCIVYPTLWYCPMTWPLVVMHAICYIAVPSAGVDCGGSDCHGTVQLHGFCMTQPILSLTLWFNIFVL